MKCAMNRAVLILSAVTLTAMATMSLGQGYPTRTIRFIVGYTPGGGTDILARMVAQKLTEALGQQVIVDNRPGANSNLAAEIAAKAPADGYTIFMISAGQAINRALYRNLNYDLERDFAPLAAIGTVPHIIGVHPSLPVKTVADLVALAKSKPGQVAFASSGMGSPEHIAAEMFGSLAGIKLLHVQYKGGNPAAVAVVGGEVAVSFNGLPAALPFIKSGRMRCLAVASESRSSVLPDVPTVSQSGVPGYEASVWYGAVAPGNTPREVVARLNSEINRIISLPDVKERLVLLGADPMGGTPEAFGAHIRASVARFVKVVKDANIQVE